jgi:hypothetical protein
MESNDMPRAVRAAARGSSRQARRTVESIEGEDGEMRQEPREDGGRRVVRQRPAWGWGSRSDGYAAAVAGGAMAARRGMLTVGAVMGGGVAGARRGRVAGSRRIDAQRQRRYQEERE